MAETPCTLMDLLCDRRIHIYTHTHTHTHTHMPLIVKGLINDLICSTNYIERGIKSFYDAQKWHDRKIVVNY